jgi:hypothetical protein
LLLLLLQVERHLLKKRKDGITVALRAVEIAGPWKILALVRLGPSPYAAMNYCFVSILAWAPPQESLLLLAPGNCCACTNSLLSLRDGGWFMHRAMLSCGDQPVISAPLQHPRQMV